MKDYVHYPCKKRQNIVLCWIQSYVGILVMKKQMQLQSRTICYSDEASCHRHVSSYNEADIQPVAENMELLRWK